ncbi:hypothetical protein VSH64_28840 [Amycolatopsis rhabdoformis]|uniref:Secreted protein n=1 Tax=Amycolatopsis rhabdoformis TaxID=1448059 RepID=A0ABZ1HXL3_9PSEU|nr:hypothetical protein [Amycolatopsis rhabdoformis]WSE26877.1 hypothetical protein VSH64_28840 [Amycolatopsis rhabdoformis]
MLVFGAAAVVFGVVFGFAVVFGTVTLGTVFEAVVCGATSVGTEVVEADDSVVGVAEVVTGEEEVLGSEAVVTGGTTPPLPLGAGAAPQPATSKPAAKSIPSFRNTLCLLEKMTVRRLVEELP